MTSNKDIDVVLSGVLCFVLTVVVAYVSYRWYEKPFLRLKRYFEYSPSNAVTR
jgi:peptidoglycan/LPS O-acetylase OafA/YrhL